MGMVAATGCKPKVRFGSADTGARDPGLRARDQQLEAQLGAACGAIGRAHDYAEVQPGELDGFLNGPAPADLSKRERKKRGKRITRARNELTNAEQMWSAALTMGACVEDLCCEHGSGSSAVTMCSQHAEDPSRAFVERFWIPLPNGLCLQATDDGVTQQECVDVPAQRWFVTDAESGKVNVRNADNRRCLNVADGPAGTVTMAPCGPEPAQRFSPKRTGDGLRQLRHEYRVCEPGPPSQDDKPPCPPDDPEAKDCVPAKCIDELGCIEAEWSDEPGASVRLAECHGGANQSFAFETTRLLQTRRLAPGDTGCAAGSSLRPIGVCPRVPSSDSSAYHFFPVPSGARGEVRWACGDVESATLCAEETRYAELRSEGDVTVLRCYE